MKMLLLFSLLITAPVASHAQISPTAPAAATQYSTLVATGSTYSGMQLQFDCGRTARKYLSEPELMEARADQAAVSNIFTTADALNYLASHGWECIGVSTLTHHLSSPTTGGLTPRAGATQAAGYSEVQYLLRRRGQ